ncbi:Mu transposase C-terminal domain-containing protein [Burkholderia sp. LMG 21824]|uniref:Mu transposase C-terminal domain-containing protein n=1 Tax=Burkholderia sp. LMG 21824 TaxID=3158172 RepID=UPI003C2D3017
MPFVCETAALVTHDRRWLDADAFARLAGIKERAGQHALTRSSQGAQWRGRQLTVRAVECVGGNSGKRLEVFAPSLPAELYEKWIELNARQPMRIAPVGLRIELPDNARIDPLHSKRVADAKWRLSVIELILATRPRSPERADAFKTAMEQEHVRPNGTRERVGRTALYQWVADYEEDGFIGLISEQRADARKPRVIISRAWDKACPIDIDAKRNIGAELRDFIRGLWVSGASGWRTVQQLASTRLIELSREAGWSAATRDLCMVPRVMIEAEIKYRGVSIHDQDAKRYFDKLQPRIRRTRAIMLPMDIVVGDVHPIDIGVRRTDGSVAYPRAVAWLDLANNRLWMDIVLLDKGQGIRQVDIAGSFARMCGQWGMPKSLYLDNGSEYSSREMINGITELSRLMKMPIRMLSSDEVAIAAAQDGREIVRAKPYNAPAKPIESAFAAIEKRVFSMVPGYVGGNRMKKKTHNVGREPMPFTGTHDEFSHAMKEALDFYHHLPQRGSLDGKSPQEAYAAAIDAGWCKTDIDEDALLLAFARVGTRVADRGYVSWEGVDYYHDDLLPYTGQRLTVRVADHVRDRAFVCNGDTLLCVARPDHAYSFLDPQGAKESARRQRVMKRHISTLKSQAPALDMVDEMARFNAASAPMPDAPVGASVELDGTVIGQMLEAAHALTQEQLQQRKEERAVDAPSTGRLNQWSSDEEYRAQLKQMVKYIDE